ncbi:flagellin N-terminal helical domain-containing protein [Leptospirillum ferrooxidans]|uniref:Flagellin n=2 Tax=root TaxID=1 RepID=I0IR67_LEPFC|nr:flagellin [Leptospirillum ferrooxidans]BAM07766.1 flagellin [Leptospirillum ferrooxidans C2-3]
MSGMIINDNIASMNAQYNLNRTQEALAKHINRLSSGYRVNSPADDPAGYAISQRMGGQVLSYNAAIRNANDGTHLLQTASGALMTDNTLLLKMRQLAIQAANGTYSDKDLKVLNQEYQHLNSEISRIARVTDFNGMKILDGSHSEFKFHVGIYTSIDDRLSVKMGKLDASSLGIGSTKILDRSDAKNAIDRLDSALEKITQVQGSIGAIQNRMEWTIKNLNNATTNVQASRAGIRDVNFASETAAFTKRQILSQSGAAVLAQANLIPQAAIKLLP